MKIQFVLYRCSFGIFDNILIIECINKMLGFSLSNITKNFNKYKSKDKCLKEKYLFIGNFCQ